MQSYSINVGNVKIFRLIWIIVDCKKSKYVIKKKIKLTDFFNLFWV